MPRLEPEKPAIRTRDAELSWQRARELQKALYGRGIRRDLLSREYGGLGLGYEYKKAFDAESVRYETPLLLNVPSFAICCATILDMGSEDQKRSHIRAALRGDEVLVQLLSEPSGGSDLAGVITRADRREDGGSSTAPRRGAPGRSPPTMACAWPGPTGRQRNTMV